MRAPLARMSLVVALALLGGCADGPGEPSPTPSPDPTSGTPTTGSPTTDSARPSGPAASPEWTQVAMPGGAEPVVLAVDGDALVVGGYRSGSSPSVAALRTPAGALGGASLVPLRVTSDPSSPYAPLARWHSLVSRDGVITAIGGAAGGAHSNTRWTTWAGALAAPAQVTKGASGGTVQERPQPFSAFGGYGAGELLDAVATSSGRFLVGSWEGTTGLDAAIWHEEGRRWVRTPSAASALASTPTALVGAVAATSTGSGILIVGTVTHLGDLSIGVRRAAAVWRSERGATSWRRVDLPDAGSSSEARSAECAPDGCVVAGAVEGRYALWWLPTTGPPTRLTTPEAAVAERDAVPAPIRSAAERVWPRADLVVAVGQVVAARVDGAWHTTAAPGRVRTAAAVGDTLYVIADPANPDAPTGAPADTTADTQGDGTDRGASGAPALWRGTMAGP